MKKIFLLLAILSTSLISAQAFKGKGDTKLQVGANVQNNATGINLSYDYGVGENISLGFSTSYASTMAIYPEDSRTQRVEIRLQ